MREIYQLMFEELQSTRPHTVKIIGRHGNYVRVAMERNPEWYRALCERYKSSRRNYPKPRTIIRREDVLRTLSRLANCLPCKGVYAERIRDVANDYCNAILAIKRNVKSDEKYRAEMALLPAF